MNGFNYKEFEKYVKKLQITSETFQTWLKEFLLTQAQMVIEKGKPRTPVDTGYLRNSWYIGRQKIVQKDQVDDNGNIIYSEKSGKAMQEIDTDNSDMASIEIVDNYLQVEIGLGAEYASYVEYDGIERKYKGKYMLTLSIEDVEKAMPARFDKDFKNWLQEKGVV